MDSNTSVTSVMLLAQDTVLASSGAVKITPFDIFLLCKYCIAPGYHIEAIDNQTELWSVKFIQNGLGS